MFGNAKSYSAEQLKKPEVIVLKPKALSADPVYVLKNAETRPNDRVVLAHFMLTVAKQARPQYATTIELTVFECVFPSLITQLYKKYVSDDSSIIILDELNDIYTYVIADINPFILTAFGMNSASHYVIMRKDCLVPLLAEYRSLPSHAESLILTVLATHMTFFGKSPNSDTAEAMYTKRVTAAIGSASMTSRLDEPFPCLYPADQYPKADYIAALHSAFACRAEMRASILQSIMKIIKDYPTTIHCRIFSYSLTILKDTGVTMWRQFDELVLQYYPSLVHHPVLQSELELFRIDLEQLHKLPADDRAYFRILYPHLNDLFNMRRMPVLTAIAHICAVDNPLSVSDFTGYTPGINKEKNPALYKLADKVISDCGGHHTVNIDRTRGDEILEMLNITPTNYSSTTGTTSTHRADRGSRSTFKPSKFGI